MSTIKSATMVMVRSTKGAVLYKNVNEGEGQPITTIYLRKSGLTEPYPGEITVTIARPDEGGD